MCVNLSILIEFANHSLKMHRITMNNASPLNKLDWCELRRAPLRVFPQCHGKSGYEGWKVGRVSGTSELDRSHGKQFNEGAFGNYCFQSHLESLLALGCTMSLQCRMRLRIGDAQI